MVQNKQRTQRQKGKKKQNTIRYANFSKSKIAVIKGQLKKTKIKINKKKLANQNQGQIKRNVFSQNLEVFHHVPPKPHIFFNSIKKQKDIQKSTLE